MKASTVVLCIFLVLSLTFVMADGFSRIWFCESTEGYGETCTRGGSPWEELKFLSVAGLGFTIVAYLFHEGRKNNTPTPKNDKKQPTKQECE